MKSTLKFGRLAILMATVGATAAAAGAASPAGTAGTVPSTNDGSVAGEAPKQRAPKNPENILDIINGRIALPLVNLIRFGAPNDKGELVAIGTNNEAAKLFGTSVGKVFDIRKGRNFGYIDAAFKFTSDEIQAAKDWMTKSTTKRTGKTLVELNGKEKVDQILALLAKLPVATAEDVAKRPPTRGFGQPAAGGTAPVAAGTAAPAVAPAGDAKQPGKLFGKTDTAKA